MITSKTRARRTRSQGGPSTLSGLLAAARCRPISHHFRQSRRPAHAHGSIAPDNKQNPGPADAQPGGPQHPIRAARRCPLQVQNSQRNLPNSTSSARARVHSTCKQAKPGPGGRAARGAPAPYPGCPPLPAAGRFRIISAKSRRPAHAHGSIAPVNKQNPGPADAQPGGPQHPIRAARRCPLQAQNAAITVKLDVQRTRTGP